MENRRLLIAFLLSAVVLIGWNYLLMTLQPPPPPELPPIEVPAESSGNTAPADPVAVGTETPSSVSPDSTPPPDSTSPDSTSPDSTSPDSTSPDSEPAAAAPESELLDFAAEVVTAETQAPAVIETDKVRAEFTNRGAQLVSFKLKEHLTSQGEPLELVRHRGVDPYPFALVVGGEKSHRLNNALFEVESLEDGRELRFRHKSERGAAEKVFRWIPDDGLLEVEVTVAGTSNWGLVFGPGVREVAPDESRLIERFAGYKQLSGESDEIRPGKTETDTLVPGGDLRWITLEDNFFLTAVMPRQGLRDVLIRPVQQRIEVIEDVPRFLPVDTEEEGLQAEIMVLLQSTGERLEMVSFFGAKQYRHLKSLPYGLEETVRWGFFGIFAQPLYYALEWIYENMVANYGWAIVLVTILIRLIFFPLTWKSQESMAKMQELNPKIQTIRNRYRNKLKDKQGRPNVEAQRQQNDEIMAVYKSAGVNPVSGCFPILLQMPIFFAFFRLLSTAVELRGAPWLGWWVRDLSDTDFILPILMGVTSVVSQQMMPQSPDPMQRRMMQMMPIMFAFFAFTFPSGLVLYWVTNNILSIIQQWVMTKLKKRKTQPESRRELKSSS